MQKNDFSVGSMPRIIVRLSIPMFWAQLVNVLYNIVDRIYLGQLPEIGTGVLAGVGLTFPIITLISAFAVLAGEGGAPLVSIARGANEHERAERVLGNAFFLEFVFALVLTTIGFLIKQPVLAQLGAGAETMAYANEYLSIYLCGTPFVMIGLGLNPYINAQGFAKTGMIAVMIGAAMNIILDPLLIYAFGMGVKGAALATVIAQASSAVWTFRFLTGKKCIVALKRRYIRPDLKIIRRICSLGFSNFTMKVTESLVQVACNNRLGYYGGDIYISVMTVINSIRQVIMLALSGLSQGMQPVVGFNYGAKLYGRVRSGIRFFTWVCIGYATVVWTVSMVLPELLIRIFNNDAEVLKIGVPAVRIYFSMFFVMSLQMAGQHSFVALGKAKQAVFFSLLRKAIIVVPLTLLLPAAIGVDGVFWAEPISDVVGSIACFVTFYLTVWRKELVDTAPAQG